MYYNQYGRLGNQCNYIQIHHILKFISNDLRKLDILSKQLIYIPMVDFTTERKK